MKKRAKQKSLQKKLFAATAIILSVILLIGIYVTAASETNEYTPYAEKLNELNLFLGTEKGFELERAPSRLEGLVLLIRFLGREEDALQFSQKKHAFTDVPDWGKNYVNYAYSMGLTNGISQSRFGSDLPIEAKAYLTFILRALGYNDQKGDFRYEDAVEKALLLHIFDTVFFNKLKSERFLRGHVAYVSYCALAAKRKDKDETLIEELVAHNTVRQEKAYDMGLTQNMLSLHFIDVGQGLSVLVKDSKGNELLFDAGDNKTEKSLTAYLKEWITGHLEYAVMSHMHADHIGGMDQVLTAFQVDRAMMTNETANTKTYQSMMQVLEEKKVPKETVKSGDRYQMADLKMAVISPQREKYSSSNDYSIVLYCSFMGTNFLLTGDAETINENDILAQKTTIKADVLQVGHHGSNTSSGDSFIKAVAPKLAVISCGKNNSYGHPHQETMDTLKKYKVTVYRTDLDGTVVLYSNGRTFLN